MNTEENIVDLIKRVEENATTDEVIRYAHKVTIDNLSDYIEDDFWSDALFEGDTYTTQQFASYMQLGVNKIDQSHNGNLVVFVNFQLFENIASKVEYKLSILDGDGKCRFDKLECSEVNEVGKYVWKFDVDWECLLNNDKVIKIEEVVVCCEIKITRKKYERLNLQNNEIENIHVEEDILNAKPRVIDSLTHKWTIDHFGNFFLDNWKINYIESNKLYSNSNKEHQFHLGLFPNGDRDQYSNNLSIFLFHSSSDNVDVNVRFKISFIDGKGDKFNTRGFQYIFSGQLVIGFGDYMSVSNLNELLHNDKIILFCEVQVIADGNAEIEDNATKIVEEFESNFNAKPQVIDSLAHIWSFENFGFFYRDEWTIDQIDSNKFLSNYNDREQFHLRLYTNGYGDECRNYLSIFVFHSSLDNVNENVRCKISIIDKNGKQYNTKCFQYTFNEKQNNQGFAKYISVSELLDHSNELLSDDRLTILCELQVIVDGDAQIEDNASTIVQVSKSDFNAKLRVIDSLVHKWTFENFGSFYRNEWTSDYIESDKFYSSMNKEQQYHLCIILNGDRDEFRNNLSVYLLHSSLNNVDVNVRFKISIIDKNGDKFNTKCSQCILNENNQGIGDYICLLKLLDHSNGLLSNDSLTILCEIQIFDFKVKHSTANLDSIESVGHSSILELNQSLDSVHLSKCAHKWTIHNFACALTEESSGDELVSCRFSSSNSKKFQFYIRILPKGHDKDSRNFVSAYIYVYLFKRMQLTFRYRISQIDKNEYKLILKDEELSADRSSYAIIDKFISHDDFHQPLNYGALRLYCEIDVIQNCAETELSRTKKEEYFGYLSKLKLNKNEIADTVTNAKAKKIQFEYTWEIENFKKMSDTESSSLFTMNFTSYPTSSYIQSPPFSSPNHSTINQPKFYLRMYPNGMNEESQDHLSIHFGIGTLEKRQLTCQWTISLIDCFGCKFNTQEVKERYNVNNVCVQGLLKFITYFDLFNQTNALITGNKLIVHCEVEFVDEEEIEDNQITIKETDKFIKPTNITADKPHSTFDSTQSITLVTLVIHHWTINNFCHYFQTIQHKSSYIECTPISHASDDQLQLTLRLYPKISIDQLFIYYYLKCNRKQMPSVQVHISILDENDRKWYTKIYRIQNGNAWQSFAELSWKDIRLEPNCVNQLKFLFQYEIITHYSSTTEMSHLDQFSLDHFTSPWKVKRLCDEPTHSRALTSIPVKSSHFEWSIQGFSSQMKSEKLFCLGQLEFSLKMYSQSQDKILIYLCLKESVEKDMKMCMKISILDKDGHKYSTKGIWSLELFANRLLLNLDVIKKLSNVELEYECTEFDINEDVIQEDDQLKLLYELNLIEEPTCSSVFVPPIQKVLPKLNPLLTNCQTSDLVLQFSNGKQLHAHRSILSFRSPVFEKMFHHDTMEAQHGQVDITDVDMEVCELMLRYIYTGLDQLDQASTLDLMIAADKYQISELKTQCEDWLCANLSIESVTDCLIWADQIGAIKLKTKSIDYFHRNAIAISQTNAIKEISKNLPDLMQELYLDSTRKFLNSQTESNLIEGEEDEDEDICVL